MKRFFTAVQVSLLLLALMLSNAVVAIQPDPDGAKKMASGFLQGSRAGNAEGRMLQQPELQQVYQSAGDVATPVFVFQRAGSGFAVVAQGYSAFQVVGYSDNGTFEAENIPVQLQALLNLYEDSLRLFNIAPYTVPKITPVVAPLLDQYDVALNQFNHAEVGNCPTGCMATAVTQIMVYHSKRLGIPIKGYGQHCYTDDKHGEICADFENAVYADNPQLLSFHVGNAMEMLYCSSDYGSSPRKSIHSIEDHFEQFVGNASREAYYLVNELNHQRPVYAGIPGIPVGHAIVVDGYDTSGLFHLNFGWGGSANGYYRLNQGVRIGFDPYQFTTNLVDLAIISPVAIPVLPADSMALVALHNSLGGTAATGWDLSKPVFSWNGVLTFNGRVTELVISANLHQSASQRIAPELGDLTALQKLHIGGCLNGTLPASITNLTELVELGIHNQEVFYDGQLYKGNLKAELPAAIGNLTKLEVLSLSNCLTGQLPASLGNLTNLSQLWLHNDTTYFDKGELSGILPAELAQLKKLQTVHITNQQLTGVIPAAFNQMPALRYLELSGNRLTGAIPNLNSPMLENLDLNDNQLTSFAEGAWNCPLLTTLNASNNQLKGSLPNGIGSLYELTYLDVSSNQLESLGEGVGSLMKLKQVKLSNNKLTSIPDDAGNWSQLIRLEASHNRIDSLPEAFGLLPDLQHLDVSYNQLRTLPSELGDIPTLTECLVNNNRIERIPESFAKIGLNAQVYFHDNEMQGPIPKELMIYSFDEYGRHVRLDRNRFIFDDIPAADELKVSVREQKNVRLKKQQLNVQIGDTLTLDVRELTRLAHSGNEYFWVEYPDHLTNLYYDERMAGIENNPVKTIVIDEQTINKKYYCKVFNPSSPSFSFEYNGSTVTGPCMYSLNTDTIGFRLATDVEMIAERNPESYVVASTHLTEKSVSEKTVTLSSPLKVRGTVQWQGSSDAVNWFPLSQDMTQTDLKANLLSMTDKEIVLSPVTPAYYRCSVQDFNCEPLYSDTIKVNPFGTTLYDQTVNVATEALTVAVDSIEVTLPAGLYDADFRLTIVKVDTPPAAPDSVQLGSVYDVTVSFANTFELPLLVKLKNVDKSWINDAEIDRLRAVYFDDKTYRWIPYESGHITLKDSSLIFETNHLTKLSWYKDKEYLYGYTDVFEKDKIKVFFKESDVKIMDGKYGLAQSKQNWHVDGYPLYVQDIAHYLNEVRTALKGEPYKLPVPDAEFSVFVRKMKEDDGTVGLLGMLNSYMTINRDIATPDKLRSLVAHEFMHYMQDKYIAAQPGNVFWMEANGHLTDRMVWDKSVLPVSESELYLANSLGSSFSIYNFLRWSWDYWDASILTQNNWGNINYCYLAGTFLHYMRSYRSGTKLNPATLLKETSWFGSWRNYLDGYIRTHLQSDIGTEYDNYVRYILGGYAKKFTILDTIPGENPFKALLSISSQKKLTEKITYDFAKDDETPQVAKLSYKIPYLATKILFLFNKTQKNDVVVRYKPLFDNKKVKVYHGTYNIKKQQVKYVDISDSTSYSLLLQARTPESMDSLTNLAFLLVVNTNNPGGSSGLPAADFDGKQPAAASDSEEIDMNFELTATPILNIERVGMLQVYSGNDIYPYSFDDNTQQRVYLGHPHPAYFASVTGWSWYSGHISSSDTLLNDSTIKIENAHYLIDDMGFIIGTPTRKDSVVYKQTILYNWMANTLKVTEVETHYYEMYPYYIFEKDEKDEIIGEKLYQIGYLQSVTKRQKTYYLKDFMIYLLPDVLIDFWADVYGSNIKMFETSTTAETKQVIEKISVHNSRIDYNPDGSVSSTSQSNYTGTDYSKPGLILRMIIHEATK
jgi:Leucine-rich repeat (LRR) protein